MGIRDPRVDAYIEKQKDFARPILLHIREVVHALCPKAEEQIKWGMPSYSYRRILVIFAAHKHHIGFYPLPSALKEFKKDLVKFHTAKGSIQFPLDHPLPLQLIRKITKFRVKESVEKDAKWRS